MKNILILSATLKKGGAERVISLLINKWEKEKDINVHLVLMEDGIDYDIPSSLKISILSQKNKGGLRKLFELPFVGIQLLKYIKKHNIETVISFLYRPNYVNIIAKLLGSKHKSIINVRSTTSRYLNEGLLGKVNLFLIKKLFNRADLIVSNSEGVDKDLKSIVEIKTKTQVIFNPVDLTLINSLKKVKPNKEFVFNDQKKYLISVGRLIKLKRNSDLIKAFSLLEKKYKMLELIFLGEGPEKENLISLSRKLDLSLKIHFLGNQDNPFYFLDNSDVFILTSETEGFPNVLVEAMATGIPVVSSDCKSGPREILLDENYGSLFSVGDINLLVKKIEESLNLENSKNELLDKNRNRLKDFDISLILNKYEEIL